MQSIRRMNGIRLCSHVFMVYESVYVIHPVIWSNYRRPMESRSHHGMPWGQIFELFPGRTPGALQLRYYIMSRKENCQAKYVTESAIDKSTTQRNHSAKSPKSSSEREVDSEAPAQRNRRPPQGRYCKGIWISHNALTKFSDTYCPHWQIVRRLLGPRASAPHESLFCGLIRFLFRSNLAQ